MDEDIAIIEFARPEPGERGGPFPGYAATGQEIDIEPAGRMMERIDAQGPVLIDDQEVIPFFWPAAGDDLDDPSSDQIVAYVCVQGR